MFKNPTTLVALCPTVHVCQRHTKSVRLSGRAVEKSARLASIRLRLESARSGCHLRPLESAPSEPLG